MSSKGAAGLTREEKTERELTRIQPPHSTGDQTEAGRAKELATQLVKNQPLSQCHGYYVMQRLLCGNREGAHDPACYQSLKEAWGKRQTVEPDGR